MPSSTPVIYPPALQPGDLIGIAAPASPFPLDRFQVGLDRLAAMGFQTIIPQQIFHKNGFLAGSDRDRAATLEELWADPQVKAIMAARGGYGTLRLLDRISPELITAHPKMIIGFSDVTALLLNIWRRTALVTIHGPVVTSLADADEHSLVHLEGLLTGRPLFPLILNYEAGLRPGLARGRLLGGNLTMIVHLLAAGQLPDLHEAILFLEDINEAPYRLDRMLTTLKLAGIFKRCRGLIFGEFIDCGPAEEIREIVTQAVSDFPGPVVSGFPVGHGSRNLALPLGAEVVLDADLGTLDLDAPFLAPRLPLRDSNP